MAHTKSLGSTKLGRDSASQRLGVKRNQNQRVGAGEVIIRQRGTHYVPGTVNFTTKKKIRFDGTRRMAKVVSVVAKV